MSYGRKKREIHEKHMRSYELFAWRDALAIANFINEEIGALEARRLYESVPEKILQNFEAYNQEELAEFIQRSESQRPAYLRRFLKNVSPTNFDLTKVSFLVLSLIGCLRTMKVLAIRDCYRYVLVPGLGNRVTTAGIYSFASEIKGVYNYSFPDKPFIDQGFYRFVDEEEKDYDEEE